MILVFLFDLSEDNSVDLQSLEGLFFIMPYTRCTLSYCSKFLSLDNGNTNQDLGAKYGH